MATSVNELWKTALNELEIVLSKANFSTWVKDTYVLSVTDQTLTLAVPHGFAKQWLSTKYHPHILAIIQKLIDPNITAIEYQISAGPITPRRLALELPTQEKRKELKGTGLNPRYTFDTFIVGKSNRLAAAAAQAVGEKPGTVYNPLFIYGGVGLGKTHLMQAIGEALLHANKRVLYFSCETFTNEFIEAVREKKMDEFKQKYRVVDALLVDDIQFIAGKEGTQEEFFHTFNTLHQQGCQIVMTSDRGPQAIPDLQKRLSSRFGWGMVADIQSPDLETRQAILIKKAIERNFSPPKGIIEYLATHIQSNIRDLEGALTKVISYSELEQVPLTVQLVEELLSDFLVDMSSKTVDPERILEVISSYFKINKDDILGKRRTQDLVYPRQILMYILRNELNSSYPKIATFLGGKDHTTVIHGCTKITKELKKNRTLQHDLVLIKEQLFY